MCDAFFAVPGHQSIQRHKRFLLFSPCVTRYIFGTPVPEAAVATITKTPSNTWKAVIRKRGWPVTIKTFPTKRDAADWARSTEDEMVRGV